MWFINLGQRKRLNKEVGNKQTLIKTSWILRYNFALQIIILLTSL